MTTHSLVTQIKEQEQDFEWYPTTEEILEIIKSDINQMAHEYVVEDNPSILDCGSGDGRSLVYLTEGQRYAIEKSEILVSNMDKSIFVIGSDFHQQTLIDKSVDIIFCNPPFSEYCSWTSKIIREAKAGYLYFVLPDRWESRFPIQEALELRDAEAEVIGTADFLNADRQARAKVSIVKVQLNYGDHHCTKCTSKTDPFDLWFEENFDIKISKEHVLRESSPKEKLENEVVEGGDLISSLVSLYESELEELVNNYKAFETLNPNLLEELGVSVSGIKEALKLKISGLKNKYWKELFDNLNKLTDRLTKSTREKMLKSLTLHTAVDFNTSNVRNVVIWAIKNANYYYDSQLMELVERMVERANVVLYKSNQKNFTKEDWNYCRTLKGLDKFSLETRVILERVGGLCVSDWSYEREKFNGLSERAYWLLKDTLTVATNLGFDTTSKTTPMDFQWVSNKGNKFYYHDLSTNKDLILMEVKAFKNGNLHVKFNQSFMCKLNVEFGRLKGWVKNWQEAAEELEISDFEAMESFRSNVNLISSNLLNSEFKEDQND